MQYIQDKLDELDDRFAIIIDEKIDDKVYKNIDYGDFYGRRDEFKDFIKEIFVDYHNHIVENIKEPSDIRKARFESDGENTFDYGYDTKTKEILSLLQDTNPKE